MGEIHYPETHFPGSMVYLFPGISQLYSPVCSISIPQYIVSFTHDSIPPLYIVLKLYIQTIR